jgi:hypothetical protein
MDSGQHDEPVTLQRLADLQAGLLDDATAARMRRRVRTDPEAARMLVALSRVRRNLAALGTDDPSAADVPEAVTDRVSAALRATAHVVDDTSVRQRLHAARSGPVRWQVAAAGAGACVAALAVVLGAVVLFRGPPPLHSAGPTAKTMTRPASHIPLSDPQLTALLTTSPDYGPLADSQRRTSCLTGLGYSAATKVLGARPVEFDGRPGVLMLLPGDTPTTVVAVIVEPNCSSTDTGLLADTVVPTTR